jgi:hypothetical protein
VAARPGAEPVLDGYEATREIKALAGDAFVPVIFLTALSDEAALARCVAVGGDDFLTKPYSRVILKAKIKIVHSGSLDASQIKYLLSPMAIFNGDMLLAARKPSGGLHVMLGDFTGHGLSAAIGTVPVADIFYGMTDKGFSIGDILATINDKLRVILPTDVFFAAVLLELDANHTKLTIWNGGVIENEQLDRAVRVVEVEAGDRIVAFSDGFIEAHNPEGEMFGLERLVATLASEADPDSMFDGLLRTLGDFVGEGALGDDLSLVEITCDPAWAQARSSEAPRAFHPRAPMRWSISIELVPDTLRSVDPLPLVMHLLMDLQGLQEHREQLYAVLMELFSNALDHGLLGLDSTTAGCASASITSPTGRGAACASPSSTTAPASITRGSSRRSRRTSASSVAASHCSSRSASTSSTPAAATRSRRSTAGATTRPGPIQRRTTDPGRWGAGRAALESTAFPTPSHRGSGCSPTT